MEDFKDLMSDNEIRVLGTCLPDAPAPVSSYSNKRKYMGYALLVLTLVLIVGAVVILCFGPFGRQYDEEPALFEQVEEVPKVVVAQPRLGQLVDCDTEGFCEIKDTIINDIPLRIFIPHNAEMSLSVGRLEENSDIIYVAQAADVRADNGGIVGAFVLNGTPRAWGLSKKGFCASINGVVTIGVAENSPLFEQATEQGGYFFRQYPLVSNGEIVENNPKGKSIRRGICDRNSEIFMVESATEESFHDFSKALVDLGVNQAVYLVGSSAYGWAVDESGRRCAWGEKNVYTRGRYQMPKNTSYILWKRR